MIGSERVSTEEIREASQIGCAKQEKKRETGMSTEHTVIVVSNTTD